MNNLPTQEVSAIGQRLLELCGSLAAKALGIR